MEKEDPAKRPKYPEPQIVFISTLHPCGTRRKNAYAFGPTFYSSKKCYAELTPSESSMRLIASQVQSAPANSLLIISLRLRNLVA
ncbi:hypothetical protein NKH72_33540 [Mesorhizobium sp. M0955]|uniref:hypothetical protein n=1 Tax=unclassified Mesorhizobium TaxID=325217 RepID=UPI003335B324